MNATLKSVAGALTALAVFVGAAHSAKASSYTATGQWASVTYGSWTVYQDEWGSTNPVTLYANNYGNFAGSGSFTGGGVKTYPHTQTNVNLALGGGHSCTSSFNISNPGGSPIYDWIYDLWSNGMADEVEVYENWTTPTGGWGSEIASNVTISGHTFSQVWQVNDGHNILMFFGSSGRGSGSEDLYGVMNWAYTNHHLSGNQFYQLSFGVEVTSTSGTQQFTCNSFSASYK